MFCGLEFWCATYFVHLEVRLDELGKSGYSADCFASVALTNAGVIPRAWRDDWVPVDSKEVA
jgi:hypothetical protein